MKRKRKWVDKEEYKEVNKWDKENVYMGGWSKG